jgi:PAS domain S-box-containing protein
MPRVTVESASEVYVDFCKEEKTIRILHVDDDAEFLAVAKQCLEEQSQFQVDTALSATEALKKLNCSKYDAVVSDYQMPETNGLEFLRELRQQENDIPFVLFTCEGKEEIAIQALNSGVYRYVEKNGAAEVTYEELKRSICDAVRGQRAEELLRQAESRLRIITENMQDLLLLLDENFEIKYVSSSYKSVLGYEPNEVIGKKAYDFVHPDDLPKVIEITSKALKENPIGRFESRVRRADGSYVLLEGVGKILKDEEGRAVGAVISSRDITGRKRIEQSLKESEEKYRKLFEEAMDAIFVADAETGIIVDCNHAAAVLTGRAKSEIIGKHQRFLHPPQKAAENFTQAFKRHLTDKEGLLVEDQIITKNGAIRDVTIKGNMIEINGKKLLRGVFRDITESKKNLEQARFQARLLNSVGQAIIATDTAGKIIYWNYAAEQFYGWTQEEMLGHNITEIITDEYANIKTQEVENQLKIENRWSGEAIFKRRDGMLSSLIVTVTPIINDPGEVIGTISVSTDISEQKWMQQVFNEAITKEPS